jgi:hypothetical protein
MGVIVKPAFGDDETYPDGQDWLVDRDRDLNIYDQAAADADKPIGTYRDGQWLRVRHDAAAAPTP